MTALIPLFTFLGQHPLTVLTQNLNLVRRFEKASETNLECVSLIEPFHQNEAMHLQSVLGFHLRLFSWPPEHCPEPFLGSKMILPKFQTLAILVASCIFLSHWEYRCITAFF